MIWSKAYNLAYLKQSEAAYKNLSFVNGTGAVPSSSLNQSCKESEFLVLIEIAHRLARYMYYLTFVSNVFFFTPKNPRQGLKYLKGFNYLWTK
jgi:hypothetical protein